MKSRIHRSYNERMSSRNINILLNPYPIKEDKISKNKELEQILFNRKSSLEVLLNLIKSFQNNYFSKQLKTNKISILKLMISSFQNDLSLMVKEKNKQLEYLKIKNENNKKKIQEILFSETQTKKVNNIQIKDNLNFPYIYKKKELKLINFQLENEIQKTEFITEQKNQIYSYIKSIPFFLDINQEIFCNTNYENLGNISDILKNIKRSVKEKFISVVKEKMETELELNALTLQVNSIRDNIINDKLNVNKKYIDTEEIIYEDTKEDNKTLITNQSKRNSYASLNKLSMNIKALNSSSKNVIKKHLSIDGIMREKIKNSKLLRLYQKNNEFSNDSKNQINNYLNMNINVNINLNNGGFNKHNYYSSSEEDDDYLSNDNQFEIELDDKNKIIVSPIQTNEDFNEEENIPYKKNKKNNYKFEINNKDMIKLYNKSSDNACPIIKDDF